MKVRDIAGRSFRFLNRKFSGIPSKGAFDMRRNLQNSMGNLARPSG